MFHLVKLVFLLSILSGTANAQWGTVVAQSDTNRFITSQYNYGLVMPHQEVIVGLLDTTITSVGIGGGNAYKVIVGSLLDYEDNCVNYSITDGVATCAGSYELWREMEKSTSWYQATRGDTTKPFPTNYAITSSTGKDSIKIWNRDTAELWMAFKGAGNGIIQSGGVGPTVFRDGILYNATENGDGVKIVDFLEDRAKSYNTNGQGRYKGNLQQRNSELGFVVLSSTPALASGGSEVMAISIVRDPFGLMDALGRPKHWWTAGTKADVNTYNPHTDNIYKWGWGSDDIDHVAIDDRGFIVVAFLDGSVNRAIGRDSEFIRSAVDLGAGSNMWSSDLSGDGDIAWAADVRGTDIVLAEPVSWAQNRPRIIYSSAAGVYNLYSGNPNITSSQARQRFSSTVNSPLEVGDAVLALALENNTTDSSPYGNTMTANNSPGTVAAVFGNGYSSTASSSLTHLNDSDFNVAVGVGWYAHYWINAATDDANDTHFQLDINNAAPYAYVVFNGDGTMSAEYRDSAGTNCSCASVGDISDGKWHHIAAVWDGVNVFRLYTDGVENCTDTDPATAATAFEDLIIGNNVAGGRAVEGLIDDFVMGTGTLLAESVAKIHAEGRKKLGMGTPVFTSTTDDALISNNVVEVDALDNGIWAVAFSDANTVQVFDGRIPVQQIAAPAGTVKSLALIQSPGADSVGVAIGTTTNLKFVQPSVNLRAAMAHQYKEPIHVGTPVVVDSAGLGGIFWTGDDAVSATDNAGRSHIFVMEGTYGGIHMTKNIQRLECASPKGSPSGPGVMFDGGTTDEGIWITSAVEVSGCGFYTAPSGAGGGNSAVNMVGGSNINFHNNVVIDADATGISISASNSRITNNTITGSDGNCITGGSGTSANVIGDNEIRNCGSNGIQLGSGANSYSVIGNVSDQAITDDVGTSTLLNEVY